MRKHTKIYLDYFDYGYHQDEFIPCELCKSKCTDVHHLDPRRMGGSKTKDYIENLIGLCRNCHDKCERNTELNEEAKIKHLEFMKLHGVTKHKWAL